MDSGTLSAPAAPYRMSIQSLNEVLDASAATIPNEVLRSIVITRIFVRTGVNLRDIQPEHDSNPRTVAEILRTFEELGYPLGGGES